MSLKKLPIDISSFEEIISNNYLYVDKTQYIYNIFIAGSKLYFLSRPRRFGKSLLISTLNALFSGNKKLFEGTWIYNSNYDWQKYPIIHLDFSQIPHLDSRELRRSLNNRLKWIAEKNNINLNEETPEETLSKLIEHLSKINKVVILIDEYDKPILDHITNLEEAEKQRDILNSFYSTIKSYGANLRVLLLTGVTRFSRTSIFSGFNNINDITMKPEAAKLLGYTQEELLDNFMPYFENFSSKRNTLIGILISEFKKWYNGYRFSEENIKVYNPFSTLYALHDKKIANYWFKSGTPTFLVRLVVQQYESLKNINNIKIKLENLDNFKIENINLVKLLFQTGYLTITNYDEATHDCQLGFSNYEVEQSFTNFIVESLSNLDESQLKPVMTKLIVALQSHDIEEFCKHLESIFAHIPYTICSPKKEAYYHALLQFLLTALSLNAQSEILTNTGRIDLVLETQTTIYIFELKFNKSAEVALKQIKDKKYYARFLGKNKKITLVGLNFVNTKTITELDFISEDIE